MISFETLSKYGKHSELYRTESMEKKYNSYIKMHPNYSNFLKKIFKKENIILLLNKFPYDLEPNILHYILWSKTKLNNSQIKTILDEKLKSFNYIYFENLKKNKSIKDIFHIQVFVKIEFP